MEKLNLQKVWAKCLEIIKDNISESEFVIWFKPLDAVSLEEDSLTIKVPSHFSTNILKLIILTYLELLSGKLLVLMQSFV